MASRKPSKNGPGKIAIQVNLLPDVAQKLKLAAVGLNLDISEVVTNLVLKEYAGLHLRGLSGPSAIGQGSGSPSPSTVSIPVNPTSSTAVINRIGKIAESSTAPVDESINRLVKE
jgi:hypothetical protein